MFTILSETPLWAYAAFCIISYYGILACFKNQETKRSLIITPTIFTIASVSALNFSSGISVPTACYAFGILLGRMFAVRYYPFHAVMIEKHRLILEGSQRILIAYWGFFALRYCIEYQTSIDPGQLDNSSFTAWTSFALGIANGMVLGRSLELLSLLKSYKN
ncbi:hypothetical protein [Pseudomonas sp. TE3610]